MPKENLRVAKKAESIDNKSPHDDSLGAASTREEEVLAAEYEELAAATAAHKAAAAAHKAAAEKVAANEALTVATEAVKAAAEKAEEKAAVEKAAANEALEAATTAEQAAPNGGLVAATSVLKAAAAKAAKEAADEKAAANEALAAATAAATAAERAAEKAAEKAAVEKAAAEKAAANLAAIVANKAAKLGNEVPAPVSGKDGEVDDKKNKQRNSLPKQCAEVTVNRKYSATDLLIKMPCLFAAGSAGIVLGSANVLGRKALPWVDSSNFGETYANLSDDTDGNSKTPQISRLGPKAAAMYFIRSVDDTFFTKEEEKRPMR